MALGRAVGPERSGSRAIDLIGDSPELVALGLLRQLAQIEHPAQNPSQLDRKWLLDAYAECLEAVQGKRKLTPAIKSRAR
jgi:hypothetical protein